MNPDNSLSDDDAVVRIHDNNVKSEPCGWYMQLETEIPQKKKEQKICNYYFHLLYICNKATFFAIAREIHLCLSPYNKLEHLKKQMKVGLKGSFKRAWYLRLFRELGTLKR